jgi:hypothetical protein
VGVMEWAAFKVASFHTRPGKMALFAECTVPRTSGAAGAILIAGVIALAHAICGFGHPIPNERLRSRTIIQRSTDHHGERRTAPL